MDITLISMCWFFFFLWELCSETMCGQPFSSLFSTMCLFMSTLPWPHLTVRPEASFLKPGPDTLDSASVLWMTGGVATDTLVLLHQRVIHQTYKHTEIHQNLYNSHTTLGVVSSFTFYITNKRSCGWLWGDVLIPCSKLHLRWGSYC